MTLNSRFHFYYGWLVVAAGFGIQMVAWGTNITFGVFFKPLIDEFGWTKATTSGASSLNTALRGLFYLVVGKLNDKYGPKILVGVCGLILGLGCILMSQANTVWQLYLFYGVLVSIGMSGSFVPVATTITSWFVKKRGMVTSVFLSGGSFGCMIMAPISNWLISNYGWRISYFIIGTISLIGIILLAQFLKNSSTVMTIPKHNTFEAEKSILDHEAKGLSFRQAIQTKQFWVLCIIIFLGSFCQFTVLVHLVSYAIDVGISAGNGAALLGIATGIGIVGRILIGIAADRIGSKRTLGICFCFFTIGFIWLLIAKTFWLLFMFAIIYGLVGSISVVLPSPMVAELFGLKTHGTILGAVMFGGTIGGAAGPLLAGHIFDITGSYQLVFLLCAILSIASITLSLFLATTGEGSQYFVE